MRPLRRYLPRWVARRLTQQQYAREAAWQRQTVILRARDVAQRLDSVAREQPSHLSTDLSEAAALLRWLTL